MVDLSTVAPFVAVLVLAVVLLPALYILDMIRRRMDYEKFFPKLAALFVFSYLFCLAAYPFIVPPDELPFESPFAAYVLVLLLLFAAYLFIFNRTKE
ncbi:MAG: hypothetical protein JXB14_04285 [Candidatus Altiarchaeota archaeon]|nr:hypothetical protein [Candidatus Altiarchaeota archaeon]